MNFLKRLSLSLVLALFVWPSISTAQQEPRWTSSYLEAEKAGQLSVCIAIIAYGNASFMVRLYEERMDFLYRRDDFTLPYDKFLGLVAFVVDGQNYQLAASTFSKSVNDFADSAQLMQLIPNEDETAALFAALRYGTLFDIVFPNNDRYSVSLRGSSNALAAASNCWDRNSTGPLVNNPFGSSGSQSEGASNPFDDT